MIAGHSGGNGESGRNRGAQRDRLHEGEGKPAGNDGKERRSGRPLTPRALTAATEGKTLTGPQKTRILNAVNHLLEQKKQEKITLDVLF